MTKAELLIQLEAFSWVDHLEGTPFLEDTVDQTNVYRQTIFEIALDTGTYRNVFFYVYDEGGAGESATYKDRIPEPSIANSDYIWQQELEAELITLYPGVPFEITMADATQGTAIIRALKDDGSPPSDDLVLAAFAVSRVGDVYTIKPILVSDDIIAGL